MGSLEEPPGAASLDPAEAEPAGQRDTGASTGSGATLCFSWSKGRAEAGPGGSLERRTDITVTREMHCWKQLLWGLGGVLSGIQTRGGGCVGKKWGGERRPHCHQEREQGRGAASLPGCKGRGWEMGREGGERT